VQANLTVPGNAHRIVELALARFGKVDAVVNAIGGYEPSSFFGEVGFTEVLNRQVQKNLIAPIQMIEAAVSLFWRDRADENMKNHRNIINVSSISAVNIYPDQAAYSAAKAALNQITLHLDCALVRMGVRANVVSPNKFPESVAVRDVVEAILEVDTNGQGGRIVTVG
jgi:NAD(P)-dependent dehydrogenase (short-subunit alcohol dehydrogenase family)